MATFELIGLYKIIPTFESLAQAAQFHNYYWLVDPKGEFKQEFQWTQFDNLGLLEFRLTGEYSSSELMDIRQNDQAPYMEFYLDLTGTKLLSEEEARSRNDRRLCFFLHFIDLSEPLEVGAQEIKLSGMSELPVRLLPFAHYVPVD